MQKVILGAEATLDRVLILDPDSTLAKILIADIKIKLGKFSSARLILDQLITDPATPGQTRDRAEELAAQINEAIDPVKVRGGYAIYAGITGNAYGRSEEGEILFGDTAFSNTAKKGNDNFMGFFAYVTSSRELEFQTPTTFEYGASVTGRETHDPVLSDAQTVTVNATFKEVVIMRCPLAYLQGIHQSILTTSAGMQDYLPAIQYRLRIS